MIKTQVFMKKINYWFSTTTFGNVEFVYIFKEYGL